MTRKLSGLIFYLLPGLGDILWISALVGAIGLGPRMMNIDGDLGRHLTIGRWILANGRVPTTDLFSHTMAGQPLTPHEWLSQVLFALADRAMGLNGVVLLSGLVIATAFWLVYRRARDASHEILGAVFAVVLAMAASSLHWLTRPHIFTFLMLALWVNVLEDLRRGRLQRWWWLPVIMLAWANLHGAFIAGFVTWGLYGLGVAWDAFWRNFSKGEGLHGRFWRYFLLGGAASLLATLANPAGPGLWATSVGYVGNRYLVSHTAEYLPPNFHDPSTWPFLVMIGLFVLALGLQGRRQEGGHGVSAARVIPAAAWLVMGLYSVRNAPLFAIVAAPLLASVFAEWLAANHYRLKLLSRFNQMNQRLLQTDLSLRGILWPVIILALVIIGYQSGAKLDFQQRGNAFDSQVFPVQAVDWLVEHPQQGNMFNHFPWGGYLLYRMWPQQRVFIDGQTDFYGEGLTRQYEQVLTISTGWEAVLEQYQVRWVIIPPSGPLAITLRGDPGWKSVYQDETAEIFVKAAAP
ncbi:MAG TPA: hypothetical protein VF806_04535 [Anaerolineaceae bacterium]